MVPFRILAVVLLVAHGVQLGEEDAALNRRHMILSKLNELPFAARHHVMKMASAPMKAVPAVYGLTRSNSAPYIAQPEKVKKNGLKKKRKSSPGPGKIQPPSFESYKRGVEIPSNPILRRFAGGSNHADVAPPPLYDPSGEDERKVSGFLIDLDGTTYEPGGLVPGAKCFFDWMVQSNQQFVLLSNTGAKTGSGTQAKLSDELDAKGKPNAYKITQGKDPIPIDHIYTAAEAQIDMMAYALPMNARLFVLSGFAKAADLWRELEHETDKVDKIKGYTNRFASWEIKTALSLEEAQNWGVEAMSEKDAAGGKGIPTYVVMFVDGTIAATDPLEGHKLQQDPIPAKCGKNSKGQIIKIEKEPKTAACYESDWSFNLFTKVSAILGPGTHDSGATLIYTADDPYNPTRVPVAGFKEKQTFPLPGPGMFANIFRKMMYPNWHRIWCAGKGGSKQNGEIKGGSDTRTDEAQITHMYGNALKRLAKQKFGHYKNLNETMHYAIRDPETNIAENIVMIGDRFDTDIAGGKSAKLKTILVTSGTHQETNQKDYPNTQATWYAPNLGELAPNGVCRLAKWHDAHPGEMSPKYGPPTRGLQRHGSTTDLDRRPVSNINDLKLGPQ